MEADTIQITSKHKALSYAFAYIGGGAVSHWKYYDGVCPEKQFIVDMLNLADFHLCNSSVYKQVMNMNPSDWFDYINSSTCVICKKPLDELDPNDPSLFEDDGYM